MSKLFFYSNLILTLFGVIAAIGISISDANDLIVFYLLLGGFQLLSGLIILFVKINELKSFKEILIYWLLVLIFFGLIIRIVPPDSSGFVVIPTFIAIYHCYMSYKLMKS